MEVASSMRCNNGNGFCINCCLPCQRICTVPGPTGPTGATGLAGPTGPTGATGLTGPKMCIRDSYAILSPVSIG